MMNNGFSSNNTQIGYTPAVTACGHTGIYSGTVPAIHGITGNAWYDGQLKELFIVAKIKRLKELVQ